MIEIVKWRPPATRLSAPPRPPHLPTALMEVVAGTVQGIVGILLLGIVVEIVVQTAIIITMLKIAKKKKKNLACIPQIGGGQNVR